MANCQRLGSPEEVCRHFCCASLSTSEGLKFSKINTWDKSLCQTSPEEGRNGEKVSWRAGEEHCVLGEVGSWTDTKRKMSTGRPGWAGKTVGG